MVKKYVLYKLTYNTDKMSHVTDNLIAFTASSEGEARWLASHMWSAASQVRGTLGLSLEFSGLWVQENILAKDWKKLDWEPR